MQNKGDHYRLLFLRRREGGGESGGRRWVVERPAGGRGSEGGEDWVEKETPVIFPSHSEVWQHTRLVSGEGEPKVLAVQRHTSLSARCYGAALALGSYRGATATGGGLGLEEEVGWRGQLLGDTEASRHHKRALVPSQTEARNNSSVCPRLGPGLLATPRGNKQENKKINTNVPIHLTF